MTITPQILFLYHFFSYHCGQRAGWDGHRMNRGLAFTAPAHLLTFFRHVLSMWCEELSWAKTPAKSLKKTLKKEALWVRQQALMSGGEWATCTITRSRRIQVNCTVSVTVSVYVKVVWSVVQPWLKANQSYAYPHHVQKEDLQAEADGDVGDLIGDAPHSITQLPQQGNAIWL